MRHIVPLALVFVAGCKPAPTADSTASAAPVAPAPVASVSAPAKVNPFVVIMTKPALHDAIAYAKPMMEDTQNKIDTGSAVLVTWAAERMTWAALAAIPETSFPKVMKDSDLERGLRLCGAGRIVQITAEKYEGKRLYQGKMMVGSDVYSFYAVGSTGDLVEKSTARFCGIVTGRHSYSNAGGGTTHAARVVGLFDLPENKK